MSSPHSSPPSGARPTLWSACLRFSERFGSMLSRVLLTVLYFGLLGPFALLYRLFADPLHVRRRKSNWVEWQRTNETVQAARRQG